MATKGPLVPERKYNPVGKANTSPRAELPVPEFWGYPFQTVWPGAKLATQSVTFVGSLCKRCHGGLSGHPLATTPCR